ncbi:MAG: hypothetical protein R6X21_08065, partial [Candidatus Aminicenantes bacterium]
DNCQKVKALEAYIAKYAGQGTTYENWAHVYYCLTPCPTKNAQTAAEAGEKALTMSGIDGQNKMALLATIPGLYDSAGLRDKANAAARKLIDFGKASSDAKVGAQLQAGGYVMLGQFAEKAGDYGAAAESYITAYGLFKDPSISKQLNGLAANLYKSGKYADAEKVFRQFYAADKGPESAALLGQTLYKQDKVDEALAVYKEAYARKRTPALAQNIAIILNSQVKTSPTKTTETINANIEAALLNPKQQKNFLGQAQNLFVGQDKELAASYAKIEEHSKAIEQLTKSYNAKVDGKNEDELSESDKRVLKKIEENIQIEQQAIDRIQAGQKGVLDKFNTLVAQVRSKLGK